MPQYPDMSWVILCSKPNRLRYLQMDTMWEEGNIDSNMLLNLVIHLSGSPRMITTVLISHTSMIFCVDQTASPCTSFCMNGMFSMGVGGCVGAEDPIYHMEKVVDNVLLLHRPALDDQNKCVQLYINPGGCSRLLFTRDSAPL